MAGSGYNAVAAIRAHGSGNHESVEILEKTESDFGAILTNSTLPDFIPVNADESETARESRNSTVQHHHVTCSSFLDLTSVLSWMKFGFVGFNRSHRRKRGKYIHTQRFRIHPFNDGIFLVERVRAQRPRIFVSVSPRRRRGPKRTMPRSRT
jgi:hypothetical protein